MTEVAWLPGLVALGLGLAIGVWAAIAIRRGRRRSRRQTELAVRDLEQRRDELYQRLREEELSAGDRQALELAAARTLRELDRLAPGAKYKPAAAPDEPTVASVAAPLGRRHPALVGFVSGLALAVLVGGLIYLAMRDSGAARAPTAAAPDDPPHEDVAALPAEVQQELARLEAAAAAAPDDLTARKRLALGRLGAGLYFDAFRDAESILGGQPEDPDGLFIQGVVRLAMGQAEMAVELFDRVLVRFPEHLQAMVYRGLALAQSGQLDQAVATWEMGLEMAGGSHPELESLLARALEQPPPAAAPAPPRTAAAAPSGAPPATALPPATAVPPATALPPATAAPAPPSGRVFRVALELEAGAAVPPGAVLFVFLRPGESGPPVAVKRIGQPRFPLQVELGAGDAMMGGELPAEGVLVARLDADGSASSRAPGDLEASAPAALGQTTRLVLGGS